MGTESEHWALNRNENITVLLFLLFFFSPASDNVDFPWLRMHGMSSP